jgi:hypothetical protein
MMVQFQNHALSLTKEFEICLDGKPCFSSLHDENFVLDIYLFFLTLCRVFMKKRIIQFDS